MSEPTIHRWETLTKKQFDALDPAECVVLVTCSPLEVHGPHLPTGADAFEGEALLERTIQALPKPHRGRTFLKLPFIYAATDTVPQRGSLFFQTSTTLAMLKDLGTTLATQGFRDIVVSNFHGSPRHFLAIESACHQISESRGIRMVPLFSLMVTRLNGGGSELTEVLGHLPGLEKEDLVGDTHGGVVETSQLLALHPDWVDPDYKTLPRRTVDTWLAERGESKPEVPHGKVTGFFKMLASLRAGLAFFRENSYSGAPGSASPELGEQILSLLAKNSAEALAEVWEGKLPRSEWHSPPWSLRWLFISPLAVRIADRLLGIRKGIA